MVAILATITWPEVAEEALGLVALEAIYIFGPRLALDWGVQVGLNGQATDIGVFGGIISISGCYYGLNTTGGTEGVGQATTRTVVLSSISILVVDYFLSQILLSLFAP